MQTWIILEVVVVWPQWIVIIILLQNVVHKPLRSKSNKWSPVVYRRLEVKLKRISTQYGGYLRMNL